MHTVSLTTSFVWDVPNVDLKLGIIRGIISEHAVAMGTVKNAFKLVTQLVDQRRSLSWLSHCKRKKVRSPKMTVACPLHGSICVL